MAFNVFAFVGHGFIDDKDRALFLVNSKDKDGEVTVQTVQTINVDDLAYEFAEIPNTVNLFLFIACRNKFIPKLSIPEKVRATMNVGISIILYASMSGQ
jgi:hypothetical protein